MGSRNRFEGKKVLVQGLGHFGGQIGAIRFLAAQGARLCVTDLKSEGELADSVTAIRDLDVRLRLGGHAESDFGSCDYICPSPAVRPGNQYLNMALASGAQLITEMGLFFELFPGRIVGITGSNGKSTVTRLVSLMLGGRKRVFMGGNIGASLLPDMDIYRDDDIAVLELSSFQLKRLGSAGRSPETAILTNISPNHLDWHSDYKDYIRAKGIIAAFQKETDTLILDSEDGDAAAAVARGRGARLSIGDSGDGLNIEDGRAICQRGGQSTVLFAADDLRLPGEHNVKNALMAAGAAFVNGAAPAQISRALQAFEGLPHRLQLIESIANISFYNDSVATTPESTAAAARALKGNAVFILGGYDKHIDLGPAVEAVAAYAAGAVCIGTTGPAIKGRLAELAPEAFETAEADTLEQAVVKAYELASEKGAGTVALSPACASYDMFANFEDRGNQFVTAVEKLKEEHR